MIFVRIQAHSFRVNFMSAMYEMNMINERSEKWKTVIKESNAKIDELFTAQQWVEVRWNCHSFFTTLCNLGCVACGANESDIWDHNDLFVVCQVCPNNARNLQTVRTIQRNDLFSISFCVGIFVYHRFVGEILLGSAELFEIIMGIVVCGNGQNAHNRSSAQLNHLKMIGTEITE